MGELTTMALTSLKPGTVSSSRLSGIAWSAAVLFLANRAAANRAATSYPVLRNKTAHASRIMPRFWFGRALARHSHTSAHDLAHDVTLPISPIALSEDDVTPWKIRREPLVMNRGIGLDMLHAAPQVVQESDR